MSLRWLPNALSVLRMLLSIPTAWLLLRGEYAWTLMVFFFAALTDAADGYLAKRFHWETELGKALDPLGDKLLLITTFIALGWMQLVPVWLAALVVLRDVVITSGAIAYRVLYGPLQGAAPTLISKLNTLVQILYVCAVVLAAAWPASAGQWLSPLLLLGAGAVVLTTLASGFNYVLVYSRRAAEMQRRRGRG